MGSAREAIEALQSKYICFDQLELLLEWPLDGD